MQRSSRKLVLNYGLAITSMMSRMTGYGGGSSGGRLPMLIRLLKNGFTQSCTNVCNSQSHSGSSIGKHLGGSWTMHRNFSSSLVLDSNYRNYGARSVDIRENQREQPDKGLVGGKGSSTLHCNSLDYYEHQQARAFGGGCGGSGYIGTRGDLYCHNSALSAYRRPKQRVPLLSFSRLSAGVSFASSRSVTTNITCRKMADEVSKAQTAGPQEETVFGMMLSGKIPAKFIYEDDQCVAFDDINPTAKIHFLVIPRKIISQLSTASEEDEKLLGHLMVVANKVAVQKGMDPDGYRVVINNGRHGCQSVYHLHLHVIGGQQLGWPPGTR